MPCNEKFKFSFNFCKKSECKVNLTLSSPFLRNSECKQMLYIYQKIKIFNKKNVFPDFVSVDKNAIYLCGLML